MNLSRLAVLAVFSMMVISAIALPSYYVEAEDEEDTPGAYFVYIMSTDRSEAVTSATPFVVDFSANPMAENAPYILEKICEGDSNGFVDGVYGTWVTSSGGNAGDFNNITSWSVLNDNGIELEKFYYNPMSDIIDFKDPMVVFEDDEEASGSGHLLAKVFDQENFLDCSNPVDMDEDDECPFDEDNPDSPCKAQECMDHDSGECEDFVSNYCENNDDPGCLSWAADYVCYNMETQEVEWNYGTEEECAEAGLMWASTGNGPDDGSNADPVVSHATMTMESLEEWTVDYSGEMPVDWSNDMRNEISNMCEMMMGTDFGEISQDCFDQWVDMISNEDHDEFRCPPGMDDAICETLMGCDDGDTDMFECMSVMYNYCYDKTDSEMCEDMMSGDEDDGGQFVWGFIAYEAGHIDATTLMEEYIIPEFGDFMDDGSQEDDNGRPVLYDIQTFDVDSDGELIIYTDFLPEVKIAPDFVCGNGEEISFQAVNDGNGDCEDGADEQWYDSNTPDDTSDDCQEWNDETCEGEEVNWFDCHDGSEVWINQVNDWEWNCEDGEDEYQEHQNYWWGDVYLFEGDHSAGITDFENLENIAFSNSYCDWIDDNETSFYCDYFMGADLFAGTWSLVTTGSCHEEWDGDDEGNWVLVGYDCYGENGNHSNMGSYSHKLQFGDAHWVMNGSIHHESMDIENFPHFDIWNNGDKEEFVMYQTQSFNIDTDSSVRIVSAGWQCYDWDEDGVDDDCHSQSPGLYIYHGEDLIASNKNYYSDNMYCPVDSEDQDYSNCGYALLEVDLVAGDYMIYTTLDSEGNYYNNIDGAYVVVDGEESDEWDGYMSDNHWEWHETDGHEVMQTVAYNGSVYDLSFLDFWNEAYDFEWYNNDTGKDNPKAFEEEFGSVYDLYETYENVLETEGEGCDDCTGNLDTMDAETSFDITSQNEFENWTYNYDFDSYYFQFIDENENDAYDSGEIYAVSSEGYDEAGGQEVLVEGTADRKYMPEPDYHDYDPVCYDEETGEEIDCDDVFEMFAYMFMIAENATHYEEGSLTAVEAADNSVDLFYMLVDAGIFDQGDEGHHDDPHDGSTEHHDDHNDNPPMLDGIAGVGGEDAEPLPLNMIGSLVDNQDTPIMMGTSFNLIFEGADESLDVHSAYIPIEDDIPWHIEMILLEGYEVKSCEECEDLEIDGNRAKFHSNEPVMVMFGKAATTEECDQIVTISEGGYTFEPAEITISVGDTVCWIWENTADVHNVLEIAAKFDDDMNLEDAKIGFYSGDSANTVDFRHTFSEDNQTHYYVCEPHATMGMAGTVTVGAGSEDDRIPEIIDDSGLPNVSFIVGALVLVGAAGLRRRIH